MSLLIACDMDFIFNLNVINEVKMHLNAITDLVARHQKSVCIMQRWHDTTFSCSDTHSHTETLTVSWYRSFKIHQKWLTLQIKKYKYNKIDPNKMYSQVSLYVNIFSPKIILKKLF